MFDFRITDQLTDRVDGIQRAQEHHRKGPSRRWIAATWQRRSTAQQGTDVVEIVNDYRDPGEGSDLRYTSAALAIAAYWQLVEGSADQMIVSIDQFLDVDVERQPTEMRSHGAGPFLPLTTRLDN